MSVAEPLIQASLVGEAVDNGPVAIFVADELGRYVAVNALACDLLGYTRSELLKLSVPEIAPTEAVDEQFTQLDRLGRLSGTAVLRHKDGSDVTIEWHAMRTTVAGMEFFVSVALPV
ncbi:MAG: PAS domain S-box protein [Actinomycetota bacterium]|nr:PAS domain S-box protein [Actinomycetota bacterium]